MSLSSSRSLGSGGGGSGGSGSGGGGSSGDSGRRSSRSSSSRKVVEVDQALLEVEAALMAGVTVRDRMYHLKTYKQCFVGSEAVDFLVKAGYAKSRLHAVRIGNNLMRLRGLFEHVTREHPLEDGHLFYRFVDAAQRGSVATNHETGKAYGWADFVDPDHATRHSDNGSFESGGGSSNGDAAAAVPMADVCALPKQDVHVACQVWPLDEHNSALLDNVHPPGWKNPIPHNDTPDARRHGATSSYDLIVIGGGAGGLAAAEGAAEVGATVALIEANLLGGDSLNVGCVPSKALLHSANLAHVVKNNMEMLQTAGITIQGGSDAVHIDFAQVMERVRRVRAEVSFRRSAERFTKDLGVEVFLGLATFESDRTVRVGDRILGFKRAIIATGSYPALLPMQGLKDLHDMFNAVLETDMPRPAVVTNETFFNLTQQPRSMIVLGTGSVGLELAQAMQRLGTTVTVLDRALRILPLEDQDLADIVMDSLLDDGVVFRLGIKGFQSLRMTGNTSPTGLPEMVMTVLELIEGSVVESQIYCDAVLVVAARRPNVLGLELEKAGIQYDTRKGLLVNEKLQTTNARVFGVGDCCASSDDTQTRYAHAAEIMAKSVIRNAFFLGKSRMSDLLVPSVTFTTPELASVGQSDETLREKEASYHVIDVPFAENDRVVCENDTAAALEGRIRFRVDAKTNTILGCSIVGVGATNLIGEVTLAIQSGTGLGKLATVVHPHPTLSESIRQAGEQYNSGRLTIPVRKVLRGLISIRR